MCFRRTARRASPAAAARRGGLGPGEHRRTDAVVGQQAVRVGQAAVRQARTARLRRSPSRRTPPPCAALRRCADSGDSGPAGRDCARQDSPVGRRPPRRWIASTKRGSSLRTTASATRSCAAKMSPRSASTDSDQRYDAVALSIRCTVIAQPIACLAHATAQQHRRLAGRGRAPLPRHPARPRARAAPRWSPAGGRSPGAGRGRSSRDRAAAL